MKIKSSILALIMLASVAAANTTAPATTTPMTPNPAIVDPSLASADQQAVAPTQELTENVEIPAGQLEEADSDKIGVLVDVNVGTLGAGFSLGYEFNAYLKARARAGFMGYTYNDEWNDAEGSLEFCGNNFGIMLDYHPFGGSFRLTAGVTITELAIDASAKMNKEFKSDYSFGSYTFYVEGSEMEATGKYEWNRVQPYIGLGWSSDTEENDTVYFTADIGINIMGSGNFSVDCNADANVYYTNHKTGVTTHIDIDNEKAKLNQALKDAILEEGEDFFDIADLIKIYPVIQLGVGVRF